MAKITPSVTPDQPYTPIVMKVKKWVLANVETRAVSNRLNQLSADGATIFSVQQSQSVGGTYEVLYYTEIDVQV